MNGNMILLLPMILPDCRADYRLFEGGKAVQPLGIYCNGGGSRAGLDAGFRGLYAGGMAVYGPARYCIPYRWAGEILCLPD